MDKFVVRATFDLAIEMTAESGQEAIERLAKVFALANAVDPLANVKFYISDGEAFSQAEIKTAIIQEWSVSDMEAEIV